MNIHAGISDYYNRSHNYYQKVWGNNISIGLHNPSNISLQEGSNNTLDVMIALFRDLDDVSILDLGSGYGETARYLARKSAKLTCLNISQVQNDYNIKCNEEEGLEDRITVVTGSFENIPREDSLFDLVISRDALMYSTDRERVFLEVKRVLKAGGDFVFTDFLISETIPDTADLSFIEGDPYVQSLESFFSYQTLAEAVGLRVRNTIDLSHHFAKHYRKINRIFEERKRELKEDIPSENIKFFVENNVKRRIAPCEKGYLKWGVLHFSKD
jgi:sarcosine/dimethylglycine N-methyltransferase